MGLKSVISNSHLLGRSKEHLALRYLRARGLKLICRNHFAKTGEIDLIMTDRATTLVFIEVRYRRNNVYGSPLATITASKQRKIRHAAAHFLALHPQYYTLNCRFDAVGISAVEGDPNGKIEWVENAFS